MVGVVHTDSGASGPPGRRAGVQALVATGLGLLAVTMLFCFDPSRYPFYPLCAFHRATGLWCPGCGSLRALHQLLHGHLVTAFQFNALLILALPLLAAYGVLHVARKGKPRRLPHRGRWLWWCAVALAMLAFGVLRNLPGTALAMPQP